LRSSLTPPLPQLCFSPNSTHRCDTLHRTYLNQESLLNRRSRQHISVTRHLLTATLPVEDHDFNHLFKLIGATMTTDTDRTMEQYLRSRGLWKEPLSRSPSPQNNELQYGSDYEPQQLNNSATTQILPRCHRCRSQITVEDRKKTKKPINGAYFKTCKRCRDNRQSARRKARTDGISKSTPPELSTSSHGLECSICADTLPAGNFPNLSGCDHGPDVCRTCFLAWLIERMDSTVWEKIECPSSGCKKLLTHEDVKVHAPEDVFGRYVFHRSSTTPLSVDFITDSTICRFEIS
jgi:hypothetical protein